MRASIIQSSIFVGTQASHFPIASLAMEKRQVKPPLDLSRGLPPIPLKKVLAGNLRSLMLSKGFIRAGKPWQIGLARAIDKARNRRPDGTQQGTISRILRGNSDETSLGTLADLADGLNVDAWLLLCPELNAAERSIYSSMEILHRSHRAAEGRGSQDDGKLVEVPHRPADRDGEKRRASSHGKRPAKRKKPPKSGKDRRGTSQEA
jgi:transcriptional regulator with XRE-family HTH domain